MPALESLEDCRYRETHIFTHLIEYSRTFKRKDEMNDNQYTYTSVQGQRFPMVKVGEDQSNGGQSLSLKANPTQPIKMSVRM